MVAAGVTRHCDGRWGWRPAPLWCSSPFPGVHSSCWAGAAVLTREPQVLSSLEQWVHRSRKQNGRKQLVDRSEKVQLLFKRHAFFRKASVGPQQPCFLLPGRQPVCVASIFKASTAYFIIYTLEGNWRYCFLWRKRKGVCGGIKVVHGLVFLL